MKVKLFYTSSIENEDFYLSTTLHHETDWDEISETEYWKLLDAINHHNNKSRSGEKLIVIRQFTPSEQKTVTPKLLASEFLKWKKEETKREEQRKIDEKNKREEAKRKRDLAKLEKLKEEYEKDPNLRIHKRVQEADGDIGGK